MRITSVGSTLFRGWKSENSLSERDLILDMRIVPDPDVVDSEQAVLYHCDLDGAPVVELLRFGSGGIVVAEGLDRALLPVELPINDLTGGIMTYSEQGLMQPIREGDVEDRIAAQAKRMLTLKMIR